MEPTNDWAGYTNLPDEDWRYGDTLTFTPFHPDSICRGRIAIGIRHSNSFPYRDLWLETSVTDRGKVRKDTLSIPVADRFGRWHGQGIGASFQITDTVLLPFDHTSGSPVKVRHIMRNDTLGGISQVGVFFIPAR